MCSIFGYFSKKPIDDGLKNRLESASLGMAHRGPDGSGIFLSNDKKLFLAHNRLSIIDLSQKASQPFCKNGYTVVFNGEIYNYRELRSLLVSKGYKLETNSDTEVLPCLYEEFGEGMLSYLRGMFAFALYDEKNDTLFCARDRVGEKPFVYAKTKDGFLFASEIPALLDSGIIEFAINEEAIKLYSMGNFRHIPDPFSAIRGVSKLKPASYMLIKSGEVKKTGFYWKIEGGYEEITPVELKNRVVEAVSYASVSDVPISMLLSGGVDSTIVAHVLKRELSIDFKAYAFGANADDEELVRARAVAKSMGVELEEFYFDDMQIAGLSNIIGIYGEPIAIMPMVYADILYSLIRKDGIKVVLNGNGADELFYGYDSHPKTFFASKLLGLFKNSDLKKKRLSRTKEDVLEGLFAEYDEFFRVFEKRNFIDYSNAFAFFLENAHSITLIGDVCAMANSVEARSPFLDYKLVETAFKIAPQYKVGRLFDKRNRYGKAILKEAFKDDIDASILYRPKMGFGFNIGERAIFQNGSLGLKEWALSEWSLKMRRTS